MRYAKLGLIALVAMLAVLMAPVVFAVDSITWRNPDSPSDVFTFNSNRSSEYQANITTSGNVNISNCSFYYYGGNDTNETQASPVLIVTNSTGNQTNTTTVNATEWTANLSAFIGTVEDTAQGILNASCESYNRSANTPVSSTQAFQVEAGRTPDAPTDIRQLDKARLERSDRTMSFSAQVNATEVTGCYVTFSGTNPGSSRYNTYAIGATSTNCTVQIARFPSGTFRWAYFATDGINDTAAFAGTREVTVSYFEGASSKAGYIQATTQQQQQQEAAKKSDMTKTIAIIAAIIVIIKLMQKGGGRRRR